MGWCRVYRHYRGFKFETVTVYEALTHRLRQHAISAPGTSVKAVVGRLGAVQAQNLRAAGWAIALRTAAAIAVHVEAALANGDIVRSWPLRGTLHVIRSADLRPYLSLTASRIIRRNYRRYRQLELDSATFRKSEQVLRRVLAGKRTLTRSEVNEHLAKEGVRPDGQRIYHILNYLGLNAVLCFGAARGDEQTFVLVDDWLPPQPETPADAALVDLTRTYFSSRGPATLDDFVWWSGLTKTKARSALEVLEHDLEAVSLEGEPAWWSGESAHTNSSSETDAYLLPAFDEYLLAYRRRSLILHPTHVQQVVSSNGMFWPIMVHRGHVVGTWQSQLDSGTMRLRLHPFDKAEQGFERTFRGAAEHLARISGATQLEIAAG